MMGVSVDFSVKRDVCGVEFLICGMAFLISDIVEVTGENSKKGLFVSLDIILARVVFPDPGGPQKIREGKIVLDNWELTIWLMKPLFPTKCSWPINSINFLGRRRSASGGMGFAD